MKKNVYLISSVLFLFWSCSDSSIENELEKVDSMSSFSTKAAGDGLYDILGYGYDCTYSDFKGSVYSKARVVDLGRFLSGSGRDANTGEAKSFLAGSVNEAILHSGETSSAWGKNLESFKDNISSHNNVSMEVTDDKLKLFSADFKSFFSNASSFSSAQSFYRLDAKRYTRKLTMSNVYPSNLKYFLTDEFINDLKSYTGTQLVSKYGTHVLTDILLGGVGSIVFNAKLMTSNDENTFRDEANSFFGIVTTSSTLEGSSTKFKDFKNIKIFIKTYGGSINIAQDISYNPMTGELQNLSFNYQGWMNSINKNTEEIIGIGNNTTKICLLSEFIDDPTKKKEVENAINTYCKAQELKMNNIKIFDYENVKITYPWKNSSGEYKTYYLVGQIMKDNNEYYAFTNGLPFLPEDGYPPSMINNNQSRDFSIVEFRGLWTFLPYGDYYRLHITYKGRQYYLSRIPKLIGINEAAMDQLWTVEKLENGKFMIHNVDNNYYLDHDLHLMPKNPKDSNQWFDLDF